MRAWAARACRQAEAVDQAAEAGDQAAGAACAPTHTHTSYPHSCTPPVPTWPAGTRVLLQMVAGFILHQPPLAVLLQQSIIMALVSNSEAYCGTPLLDNPRAAQRMARFSGWLDCVPLFTVPLTSASALHRQGEGGGLGGRVLDSWGRVDGDGCP